MQAVQYDRYGGGGAALKVSGIRFRAFLPSSSSRFPVRPKLIFSSILEIMLQLVEIPIPSPKKGQILLKVEATSLNPADWKIQSGALRPILPPRFPFTPGLEITIIRSTLKTKKLWNLGNSSSAFRFECACSSLAYLPLYWNLDHSIIHSIQL